VNEKILVTEEKVYSEEGKNSKNQKRLGTTAEKQRETEAMEKHRKQFQTPFLTTHVQEKKLKSQLQCKTGGLVNRPEIKAA
jgi:hypothetical protein